MRDFNLTVKARAARDPEFACELIAELIEQSKRLRALVRKAYAEGFIDGGTPSNPLSSNYPCWETSKTKQELSSD